MTLQSLNSECPPFSKTFLFSFIKGSGNGDKSIHELKYVGDDEDYDEEGSGCEGSGECSVEPTTTKPPWEPWT